MKRHHLELASLFLLSCLLALPAFASAANIVLTGRCVIRDVENVAVGETTVTFNQVGDPRAWTIPLEYYEYSADKIPDGCAELRPEDVTAHYTYAAPPRAETENAAPKTAQAEESLGEPEPVTKDAESLHRDPAPPETQSRPPRLRTEGDLGGNWCLFGNVGYGAYAMSDLNAKIASNNDYFAYMRLPTGALITGGVGGFGGVAVWITDYLQAGAEFGVLGAGTLSGDTSIGEKLNFSAMETGVFMRLGRQVQKDLVLSGGFGLYDFGLTDAYITEYSTGLGYPNETIRLSGQTMSFKFIVGAEYRLGPVVGLALDAGYRQAVIPEMRVNGGVHNKARLINRDGSSMQADYSGLFVQTGLRLYFH